MTDRLGFTLRENLGRLRQPEVLSELSEGFGRPLGPAHVLPLEDGDRLRRTALPLAQSAQATERAPGFSTWSESASGPLRLGLAAFGSALGGAATLYLPFAWDFLGPIVSDPARDFGRCVAVARGRTEECPLCSTDASNGLWLQYHASDAEHGEEHPYELVIWGAEWQALARRALPFEFSRPEA